MKTIELPYGHGTQSCSIPNDIDCVFGRLKSVEPSVEAGEQISAALLNLIGDINFDKLRNAKSVAIAVSDMTRPVPSRLILEKLLPWLAEFGIYGDQITVLVGGGLHHPATQEEMNYILGEELSKRVGQVLPHDADDKAGLTFLGTSPLGTPVYVNKHFAQADFKIVTGMVDAHQFMGFTAGVKGAVIGLGGRETITGNHVRLFQPGAELGQMEGNPARIDLEDCGRIIGVDMIVNVVLNTQKKVVKAVAGHPRAAHGVAVEFAKSIFGVSMSSADIVIASPGGFPKDINAYQAQKALTPALQLVKPGGTIILVAQCIEGSGEESFEETMSLYDEPSDLVTSFKEKEFVIGPHKAYLWARTFLKAQTILVSDKVSSELAKTLMVKVTKSLQEAIDDVIPNSSANLKITVLPNANSVIPILRHESSEIET
ncbi:MAG TPA: nickel-dependent lactate racemase [Desulfitobacterium dehalogenans]|uniref:Nickel-dependent lactate racemase n=1 Tax=Desulfitobacterium dehalogenans TaxID=36854 RepID=A0A7C6Z4Y6_9FIRM|nr:nickel-dependent lactate racemase [Desulfitobacterium dehalogenans]